MRAARAARRHLYAGSVRADRPRLRRPRAIFERVKRAIALTENLSSLPYANQDAIRAAWAELTETEIDPTLRLIPPVYSDQGVNVRGHA